jgi:hypothetical protein
MSIRNVRAKLVTVVATAVLAGTIAGLTFVSPSFASGPANGTQVPNSALPIGTYTAGTPFSSGQIIQVSIPANSNLTPGARVNILECADPGGTAENLPTGISSCDGNTVQGDTVLVNSNGSVSYSSYTVYAVPDPSIGDTSTTPTCNDTNECVLYIGQDQTNFAGAPYYFSQPFFVNPTPGDTGSNPGDGSSEQTITFTTSPPNPAGVGGTYTPAATGGGSGEPVVLSIDASSTGCTLSSGVVHFNVIGTCVIDANQAGSGNYAAATQVSQSFAIRGISQNVAFTSANPSPAEIGATYTPTVSGGASGNPVLVSIGSGPCSLSGTVVHFTGAGTCTIHASQQGNAAYDAGSASQSVAIGYYVLATAHPTVVLPGATPGASYSAQVLASIGGSQPYKFKATGLPKGLKMSKTTGLIAGTPKVAKHPAPPTNYSVTVTVESKKTKTVAKVTASQTFSIEVS